MKFAEISNVANQMTLKYGDYLGLCRWIQCNDLKRGRRGGRREGQINVRWEVLDLLLLTLRKGGAGNPQCPRGCVTNSAGLLLHHVGWLPSASKDQGPVWQSFCVPALSASRILVWCPGRIRSHEQFTNWQMQSFYWVMEVALVEGSW